MRYYFTQRFYEEHLSCCLGRKSAAHFRRKEPYVHVCVRPRPGHRLPPSLNRKRDLHGVPHRSKQWWRWPSCILLNTTQTHSIHLAALRETPSQSWGLMSPKLNHPRSILWDPTNFCLGLEAPPAQRRRRHLWGKTLGGSRICLWASQSSLKKMAKLAGMATGLIAGSSSSESNF